MIVLRYAILGLAVLAILWPATPPDPRTNGLAGSEWRVVEIGGAKVPGAGTLRFTLTSIRGKAPCNTYMGAFRESAAGIVIGGISDTRMLCDGRMELEQAFLDSLARARSYLLDGSTLVLKDAAGVALLKLSD